ncbi:MAG TPA: hypothetical protein VL171_17685 [Verrucomicrobiae bacterium]|nr:hypothetical protein [Verrucomicrobiae bacterium]
MHRVRRGYQFAGILAGILFLSPPIHAQYTADFQTNIISGVTSNWIGDYSVGSNTFADVLRIQSGGVLSNGDGYLGYDINSSNNSAFVTDSGSVWNLAGQSGLIVGNSGSGNSLIISNGGSVSSRNGYLGYNTSGQNNRVLVSDTGSVWSIIFDLGIGLAGAGNSLVISNGGSVGCTTAFVGNSTSGSSNNNVFITGPGSTWSIGFYTYIGYFGVGNSLVISNGAKVLNNDGIVYIGLLPSASNNNVLVSGTGSTWSNVGTLYLGYSSAGNRLVIEDGGCVFQGYYSADDIVGRLEDFNSVLVSGSNSIWSTTHALYLGYYGSGNSLVVSNGGQVVNSTGHVGGDYESRSNSVLIVNAGSVWSNSGPLYIGDQGQENTLVISDGGRVVNSVGYVGHYQSFSNSVRVTGLGSIWHNDSNVVVGSSVGSFNSLVIENGGRVEARSSTIGTDGLFDSALVTGDGSVWSNSGSLSVGPSSASLVISNGGIVIDADGFIGGGRSKVLISDAGSIWSNTGTLMINGDLVISNGGQVVNGDSDVGLTPRTNCVRVTNGGRWWNSTLHIGEQGKSNSVVIAGGSVLATNLVIGVFTSTCDDWVQLDSGNLVVTNPTHDAVLEVRNGKLMMNGGTLLVDRFVMTNACAQFVRTGGTLIYGAAVLDPNRDDDGDGMPNGWEQSHGLDPLDAADANVDSDGDGMSNLQEYLAGTDPQDSASSFRITSLVATDHDVLITWMMGSGKTNALQSAVAAGDGGYYTNGFADIFTVTNTTGTLTNYFDVGAATNGPMRFYRVRLIP